MRFYMATEGKILFSRPHCTDRGALAPENRVVQQPPVMFYPPDREIMLFIGKNQIGKSIMIPNATVSIKRLSERISIMACGLCINSCVRCDLVVVYVASCGSTQ